MALDPNQLQLPQIPMDIDMALRNYLQQLQDLIAQSDQDTPPPALVTGVSLNPIYPGIVISWNQTIKAHAYILYRNAVDGTFASSVPITELNGNGNVSFFDVTQALGTGTIYYWVQGVNNVGIPGPVSAMASTGNSQAPGPGIIPGVIDPSLMILAIPDDDLPQDFGIAFLDSSTDLADSGMFWATTDDDEDFITAPPFSTDYRIP